MSAELPASTKASQRKRIKVVRQIGALIEELDEQRNVPGDYSAAQMCEILQVHPQQITGWTRAALICPHIGANNEPRFDFSQVAVARTLVHLAQAGVSTGYIRRSLEKLRRWLPDADRWFDQLATVDRHKPFLIRLEAGHLVDHHGQMHLDYAPDDAGHEHLSMAGPSAAEWFEQGCVFEEQGDFKSAANAYREALLAGGPDAGTVFNLANVLYALGKKGEAAERYRQAVEIDPRFVEAWNNLGVALSELEQCDEAVHLLRRASEIMPEYSDALFNLAECLEENGCTDEALRCWEKFARTNPIGQWGDYCRERLKAASQAGKSQS